MGSHSYLVNLNSCAGVPAAARQYILTPMQCRDLQNLMIGPAYTYNTAVPKPLGVKDMGSYTGLFYTDDQLNNAKLQTGLVQGTVKPLYQVETEFNNSYLLWVIWNIFNDFLSYHYKIYIA